MVFEKVSKSPVKDSQTAQSSSGFTSRPFAPIIQPPISTPLQQPEQTERLLQRKRSLLPISLMPPPTKVIQAKLTIGEAEDEYKQIKSQFVQRREAKEMQQSENKTGLPENIKTGVENLSEIPMDDVRVHYNSNKPSQLRALAYTQGTDIHVAPGQEKHLPHEAWHVAQQKLGRVKPTIEIGSVKVNDDPSLEREADTMGSRILQMKAAYKPLLQHQSTGVGTSKLPKGIVQQNQRTVQPQVNVIQKVSISDDEEIEKKGHISGRQIDAYLITNPLLKKYAGGKMKGELFKGLTVLHDDKTFNNLYIKQHILDGDPNAKLKEKTLRKDILPTVNVFTDPINTKIHVRMLEDNKGVLLSRGIYGLQHPVYKLKVGNDATEGTADYFTGMIVRQERLPLCKKMNPRYYESIEKLVEVCGFEAVAAAYFQNNFSDLKNVIGSTALYTWADSMKSKNPDLADQKMKPLSASEQEYEAIMRALRAFVVGGILSGLLVQYFFKGKTMTIPVAFAVGILLALSSALKSKEKNKDLFLKKSRRRGRTTLVEDTTALVEDTTASLVQDVQQTAEGNVRNSTAVARQPSSSVYFEIEPREGEWAVSPTKKTQEIVEPKKEKKKTRPDIESPAETQDLAAVDTAPTIEFMWCGEEVQNREDLEAKIKEMMPNNTQKSAIGRCITGIENGQTKATTRHPNVKHYSVGKAGNNDGCTLFFEVNTETNVKNIVGVGRHESSSRTATTYTIYMGQERFGKTLRL